MENRRKRKFQGMQWIFLKDERRSERNNLSMLESMVSQLEESLENDFEDFPIVITRNSMAWKENPISINESSIRDKYKLNHIDDIPSKSYKSAHIELEEIGKNSASLLDSTNSHPFNVVRRTKSRRVTPGQLRPKSMEIRKVMIPPKQIPRIPQLGEDTPFNRRKSYGKWFLPPENWNNSLNYFVKHSKKMKESSPESKSRDLNDWSLTARQEKLYKL